MSGFVLGCFKALKMTNDLVKNSLCIRGALSLSFLISINDRSLKPILCLLMPFEIFAEKCKTKTCVN